MNKHIALLLALTAVLLTPTALKPQAWEKIPGKLDYISVGNKDTIWGIYKRQPYRWYPSRKAFMRMPGYGDKNRMHFVAVGPKGSVWGVYKKTTLQWSEGKKRWFPLAVGTIVDKVYVLDKNNAFGIRLGTPFIPSKFYRLSRGKPAVEIGTFRSGIPIRIRVTDFDYIPRLKHLKHPYLFVGWLPAGVIGTLYAAQYTPGSDNKRMTLKRVDTKFTRDVSVGPGEDHIWRVFANGEIEHRNKKVEGRLKGISAAKDDSGEVWGVNKKGEIYRYTKLLAKTEKKAIVGAKTYRDEALKALKDVTSKFGPNLSPEAKNKISNYRENVMYKWMRYIGTWNIQQKRKIIEDLKQLSIKIKADTQEIARETKEALEEKVRKKAEAAHKAAEEEAKRKAEE